MLDLGCGPGLYSHRLATLGHRVHGIDFGPASIAYAGPTTTPDAASSPRRPAHEFRAENRWPSEDRVAVTTFTITDTASGIVRTCRSTTRAWTDDQLRALLVDAGFTDPMRREDWPVDNPSFMLWTAVRH